MFLVFLRHPTRINCVHTATVLKSLSLKSTVVSAVALRSKIFCVVCSFPNTKCTYMYMSCHLSCLDLICRVQYNRQYSHSTWSLQKRMYSHMQNVYTSVPYTSCRNALKIQRPDPSYCCCYAYSLSLGDSSVYSRKISDVAI